jgi:hypothetical protein
MFKGQVIAVLPRADATREGLGLLMAGVSEEQPEVPSVEEVHVDRT